MSSVFNFFIAGGGEYRYLEQVRSKVEDEVSSGSRDLVAEMVSGYSVFSQNLSENFFVVKPGFIGLVLGQSDSEDCLWVLGSEIKVSGSFCADWSTGFVVAIEKEMLELMEKRCEIYSDINLRPSMLKKTQITQGHTYFF